jgi:hypothetical protein
MHDALSLLSGLTDADIDWLLQVGKERAVAAGATIIAEGSTPTELYFVLGGMAELRIAALGETRVATLGPGELLGEISWLEERSASATVLALETVRVLAVARDVLARRGDDDPAFAARLYRAFARVIARRLRERVPAWGRSAEAPSIDDERWRRLSQPLERFKAAIRDADRAGMGRQGEIPPAQSAAVREAFDAILSVSAQVLHEGDGADATAAQALGAALHRELLPYVLLGRSPERAYTKPRGYAGDYLTIEWIYRAEAAGVGRVGPLIDRCFLDLPVAQAVRNRRGLLATEIHRAVEANPGRDVRVTSMACGPARELFDVFGQLDPSIRLTASLVDIDAEALEFVRRERSSRGLDDRMELHLANLVHLATGRQRLELPPQHLVYSIGLIDYFDDRFVVSLIDYVHGLLHPGGRLILGNFHPRNQCRAVMESALDWKLIHRTEDDLNRLYAASRFGRPCSRVLFENEGINMFAECVRDS